MKNKKRILDMYCGSKSIASSFDDGINEVFTLDNEIDYSPSWVVDILKPFDVLWASPPCTTFSVASIGHHWNNDHTPKTKEAIDGLEILNRTVGLIAVLKPKYWFIENPRGKMRKVIDDIFKRWAIDDYIRHTVTYCSYGDHRMKPTDIWTNNRIWKPLAMCKNGDKCHESAPRGSRTGTQGINSAYEKSKIPKNLCDDIVKSCL